MAQFSLYVGMSGPYRLSSVVMPAVFVGAYWADRLMRATAVGQAARRVTAFAGYVAVGLTLSHFGVQFGDWLGHDGPGPFGNGRLVSRIDGCPTFPDCFIEPVGYSPMTKGAEILIARHVGDEDNLAVILAQTSTAEVLMRSGRRNAVSMNAPFQDGLVGRNADRIMDLPQRLEMGDILITQARLANFMLRREWFAGTHPSDILVWRLLNRVGRDFAFQELSRDGGIVAVRLVPKKGSGQQ